MFDPPCAEDLLPEDGVNEFVDLEIAARLRLSRRAAHARLDLAVRVQRVPAALAALRAGVIDLPKMRAITDAVSGLDDAAAEAVAERVLVRAPNNTASQLRAALNRAVLAHDPAAAQVRHEQAVADRRVVLSPEHDGMASVWALRPADQAVALYTAVCALADQGRHRG